MKFKIKNKLEDILHKYCITVNEIYFLNNSGGYCVCDKNVLSSVRHFQKQEKYYHIGVYNNMIFLGTQEEILILENSQDVLFKIQGVSKFISNNDTLFYFDRFQSKTICFSLRNKEILWSSREKIGKLRVMLNKTLFYSKYLDDAILNAIDISTGTFFWKKKLGSGTFRKGLSDLDVKISHLIGVWKNQLLIWMNNEQLVCLDVNTGTELWRITDFINQFLPNWQSISQFSFVYCHIENGKLYQLDGDSYWSLDLATQEFELLWQDTQKEYLTIIHKTYTEDFIYFTASRNYGLVPYLIGVFNRKTLSIEWLHDARLPQKAENNFCNSLNQAPQVDGDRLYVLDSGGTLHIFEKESSIE